MRLIDADALKEAMSYNGGCGICFRYVDDADTIDAEPVRHGRWLRLDEAPEWDQRRCSECGDISCCQRNYCPNCGAKMDGDGDAR
jgi:hypothetical protein